MTSFRTALRLLPLLLLALLASHQAASIPISSIHRPYHAPTNYLIQIPRGGAKSSITSTSTSTKNGNNNNTANNRNPLSQFLNTIYEARSHLAAAACARATSIFGMYPVDTIKTRMQIGNVVNGADSSSRLVSSLGGLYKGVWGSLIGQVPYGVLTFGSYEIYKQSLLNRFPSVQPPFIYALSAILGDITGSGWLCPSEVMKQQLQAGMYSSMGEAVRGIWNKDGIAGFYRGFTGGLARDVPFRVAQLTTFECVKSLYLRTKKNKKNCGDDAATKTKKKRGTKNEQEDVLVALSPLEAAICGAAAGSFSAAITNPLDRIKTIMMTDTAGVYGGSVAKCAAKIVRDDGIGGLFKGVVPRVGYIAPSVCIFFVTYEMVQQRFKMNSE